MTARHGELDCIVDEINQYLKISPAITMQLLEINCVFSVFEDWALKCDRFAFCTILICLEALFDYLG